MSAQQVWSPSNKRLVPLTQSGVGGGQTEIFWFRDDPALCAGMPKPGGDLQAYWAKIAALIGVADRSVAAAWPQEILCDPTDRTTPRAFSMPRCGGRPLAELVIPAVRQSLGLNWGLTELREVAVQLVKLFEGFERLGVSQCDSHGGNYLLDWDPQTLAPRHLTRVDCLAFGFDWRNRYYGSDAAVYQFLPPELHATSLSNVRFSREADRFSLACLLFPILTGGGYPWNFGGAGGTPAERVAARQFAPLTNPKGTKVAPAVEAAFFSLHETVRVLFERAFLGEPASRPTPKEWLKALRTVGQIEPSARARSIDWKILTEQVGRRLNGVFTVARRSWWLLVAALATATTWVMLANPEPNRDVPTPITAPDTGKALPTNRNQETDFGSVNSGTPLSNRKPKNPDSWKAFNR